MAEIQFVVDQAAKNRYRRAAAQEGMSLSAWLRSAADDRIAATVLSERINTVGELRNFFRACDGREEGREPDWEQHLQVIRQSRA